MSLDRSIATRKVKPHIKILILSGIGLALFILATVNVLSFMIPNLFTEEFLNPPGTYWLSIPCYILSFAALEISHYWDDKLKRRTQG